MPGIDKKLKKVNPRKTITNKQSGIDGPSRTVKKYDASDFSTSKKSTKKDMLAIKANPKKSVKGMKNTFKDDTTAKRKSNKKNVARGCGQVLNERRKVTKYR